MARDGGHYTGHYSINLERLERERQAAKLWCCYGVISQLIENADRLVGATERDGYSLVATAMYWKKCWVKLEFHLAKVVSEWSLPLPVWLMKTPN